jgi:(p)ppGpp synthase/HD superfamily hydrolase
MAAGVHFANYRKFNQKGVTMAHLEYTHEISLALSAKMAAVAAHELVGQVQTYYAETHGHERYYFHSCRVAERVALMTNDEEIMSAAALHDVIADVAPKLPELAYFGTVNWLYMVFGARVLWLVVECTDVYSDNVAQQKALAQAVDILLNRAGVPVPDYLLDLQTAFMEARLMSRAARKQAELERYLQISEHARIIKRADLFDDVLNLRHSDVPIEFARTRLKEINAISEIIDD